MIVRLDKEQQTVARRQLLSDVVWVICNDTLRMWQHEGKTTLAPVEVFMSAQRFCEVISVLSDIDEGIDYELDDLEDEAEGKNDAMLIAVLAALQMQAMNKRHVGLDNKKAIMHIFECYGDHELFFPLVEQWAKKEEKRWVEGKKTDLLDYELREIRLEGGGLEKVKEFIDKYIQASLSLTPSEIRSTLIVLSSLNQDYHHAFDEHIAALCKKLGVSPREIHNHFEKDSHCQVFNDEVIGQFK